MMEMTKNTLPLEKKSTQKFDWEQLKKTDGCCNG